MIHLVHLYPSEMNIYGDTGNRIILEQRMRWRGIAVKTSFVGVGDTIPKDADIILGGGGQDAGQSLVQDDLQAKQADLQKLADKGVVMLMVCGLYQLFGRSFTTHEGTVIKGIGILPLETIGGDKRLIGNTIYDSEWGPLVGYENHSGITTLDNIDHALARVTKGAGNNGNDGTEGCRVNNVFGTYSHGPVLSKNPQFADELIRLALKSDALKSLDDEVEQEAARLAKRRLR